MTTLATVIGKGVIGSRPAAASAGRLYFSTEPKTYRDNGSSWDDVSDAGTAGNLTGDVTSVGLATTIGAGKVTEAMQVLANNTTQNVSTTKHGYAPILPNDATKYLDGTGAYTVPAGGGGGGVTQSYLGYNTIGGSTEVITANRIFMKKFTMASAGLVNELELYLDEDADQVCGLPTIAVWADNAGVPDSLIAQQGDVTAADNFYLGASSSSWPARWIGVGSFGKWLTAADYWVGWMFSDVGNLRMYYDAGSDRILPTSAAWLANGDRYVQSDSTHKFSGRVSFLTL